MRRTGSEVIGGPLEITLERAFFSPITLVKFRSEALDLNAKTAGPLLPSLPYGFSPFIIWLIQMAWAAPPTRIPGP